MLVYAWDLCEIRCICELMDLCEIRDVAYARFFRLGDALGGFIYAAS
jgi:hypothetical protein